MISLIKFFQNPLLKTEGIFYVLVLLGTSVFAQPKAEIKDSKNNFGFVRRGELVNNVYEIKNIGNAPLLITDVEIACSCTTVEFSKQPVLPGQSTNITVVFNTATVYGRQDRVVIVNSNSSSGPFKLRYKGVVSGK